MKQDQIEMLPNTKLQGVGAAVGKSVQTRLTSSSRAMPTKDRDSLPKCLHQRN